MKVLLVWSNADIMGIMCPRVNGETPPPTLGSCLMNVHSWFALPEVVGTGRLSCAVLCEVLSFSSMWRGRLARWLTVTGLCRCRRSSRARKERWSATGRWLSRTWSCSLSWSGRRSSSLAATAVCRRASSPSSCASPPWVGSSSAPSAPSAPSPAQHNHCTGSSVCACRWKSADFVSWRVIRSEPQVWTSAASGVELGPIKKQLQSKSSN